MLEVARRQKNIGDSLYDLLDNEENGITIIQEISDNETDIMAWNCIIDAVAYTSRKVLEREGIKYYPEPIALVDDTLVEHFIDCFERCIKNSDSYIKKINILLNYSKNWNIAPGLRTAVLRELKIQN